jgi:nicotinamide riboside transporter PnuC
MLSITATVANVYKRRWCFWLWAATNAVWCAIDFAAGIYSQSALFAVYCVLSIWGAAKWR